MSENGGFGRGRGRQVGLFKNSLAPTKPPETAPIRPPKAPPKVLGAMIGRIFPLPKSAGAVVGNKICKPKRNRTEPIYIYIYIYLTYTYIIYNHSSVLK